jgi:hypothetical protein
MQRLTIPPETEFGDLLVVREVESPVQPGKRCFLCRCSCGREVPVRLDHLRSGHTSSCGSCGLELDGVRKTVKAWAVARGIKESTLRARLKVMGLREALERR